MRQMLTTLTVVTVFAFGMTASMAQTRQDPGAIRVNPPQQQAPVQTQPSTPPNLNTSKNPYQGNNRYLTTPSQQRSK